MTIAADAESRVKKLYERIWSTTSDPRMRATAGELVVEKSQQVSWLKEALASLGAPLAWHEDMDSSELCLMP